MSNQPYISPYITLPNGIAYPAEIQHTPLSRAHGMQFRRDLRGVMVFMHERPGAYVYHMRNVRIPLDIVFLDSRARIVHIAEGAQPDSEQVYGGVPGVQFVIEGPAGWVERNRLGIGDQIRFVL